MKTLYILNNPHKLQQCASAMTENDALLLIEDAVIVAGQLEPKPNQFVLEEDLIARGLASGLETVESWPKKNYEDFVALTLEYDKSVSWL